MSKSNELPQVDTPPVDPSNPSAQVGEALKETAQDVVDAAKSEIREVGDLLSQFQSPK